MNIIIIIDDKIVTKDVERISKRQNNTYFIKFRYNPKLYNYQSYRIKIIKNLNKVDINNQLIYINGILNKNIKELYENKEYQKKYYKVIYDNNLYDDYSEDEIKIISKNNNILDYLKKISTIISLSTESGKKILREQMEKIKVNNIDTALANYFKMNDNIELKNKSNNLIFPFGCNSSQYKAVENAINNKISVIEGPPGTGKTQTILNIIANIIVRDMNTQVVSNNNSAIENIIEKLKKYDLDFIAALLGKNENKDEFIENQNTEIPSFKEYQDINVKDIENKIIRNNDIVKRIYDSKQLMAKLTQEKNELTLEYKYFKNSIKNKKTIKLKHINHNIIKVFNEISCIDEITIYQKIKYILFYRIGNFKLYNNDNKTIINSIKNELYKYRIKQIEDTIDNEKTFIDNNKDSEKEFINSSMDYFKKYLSKRYNKSRKIYSKNEILNNGKQFLKDYPVILSTTYSSRNTFNDNTKMDYIIMDEASQIDVVTGTLALSSANNAVVIGDDKQLPNVIPNDIKEITNKIFDNYDINNSYNYSYNSFLSSIKKSINNVPKTMLKEHYRCHPKIINFCNKKFYNNELIIMTEDKNENDVIKVIKTNKGNHTRDKTNQRQIDIIKEELLNIDTTDIGIIAPYNNQVNLIKKISKI